MTCFHLCSVRYVHYDHDNTVNNDNNLTVVINSTDHCMITIAPRRMLKAFSQYFSTFILFSYCMIFEDKKKKERKNSNETVHKHTHIYIEREQKLQSAKNDLVHPRKVVDLRKIFNNR